MKFTISLLDYLGKLDGGVISLLSVVYGSEYYESTFFYDSNNMILTISNELEDKLGYKIVNDPEYTDIIIDIMKRVIPFDEIYYRLDDLDMNKWTSEISEEDLYLKSAININNDDVKSI